MKYLMIIIIITNIVFSMNLTSSDANKAIRYLKKSKGKGVLIYENDNFKYLPIKSIYKKKGYIDDFGYGLFKVIHEDSNDDYHIIINGEPIDLAKIYYRKGSTNTWIRVASKIKPANYTYRENRTIFVYKKSEKIPASIKKKIKNKELIKKKVTKIIKPIDGGGVQLEERPEDKAMNEARVLLKRRKFIER